MSRKHLAALMIALAVLSEPAAAELRGTPEGPPVFTAAEVAIITRNAVLAVLIQDNPWAVRRVLDAMAAIDASAGNKPPSDEGDKGDASGGKSDPGASFDPRTNPDLDQLQRTSPEAVLDLFRILKQATPAKPSTPQK
jgi:hypothetical protein